MTEEVKVSTTDETGAQTNGTAAAPTPALSQELQQAQQKAAEYLELAQRARAELANYRRRVDAERATLSQTANARLLMRILPVLDDFERAFETLPVELRNLTWIQGIAQIYRKLQVGVEAEGATPIDAVGKPFDPKVHDAILQEPSADYPEGTVSGELQRGYTLGDRVLRPTLVRVSSGPGPKATEAASASGGSASEPKTEDEGPAKE